MNGKIVRPLLVHMERIFFLLFVIWLALGGAFIVMLRNRKASPPAEYYPPIESLKEDSDGSEYGKLLALVRKAADVPFYASLFERDVFVRPVTDDDGSGDGNDDGGNDEDGRIIVTFIVYKIEPIVFPLMNNGIIPQSAGTAVAFLRKMEEAGAPQVKINIGDTVSGYEVVEIDAISAMVKVRKGDEVTELRTGEKVLSGKYTATLYIEYSDGRSQRTMVKKGDKIGTAIVLDISTDLVIIKQENGEETTVYKEKGYE